MPSSRSKIVVKYALPVVVLVLALLVGQFMASLKDEPKRRSVARPSPVVDVQGLQAGPVQLVVNSQGTVSPKQRVEWASEVAGRVTWVAEAFVEGAAVSVGTRLLRLDPTDYRVALAEAQSGLADAKLALLEEQNEMRRGQLYRNANQQAVQSQGMGSNLRQPKLQLVETQVKAAQERVRQAEKDLLATELIAPFDAVIDNKQVDIGQYVAKGSPLFSLLGTDTVEVRLPVTATDIGFIRDPALGGEPPLVILAAEFGRESRRWQGRLVRVEQRVDSDTRTFFVVVEVDQPYNEASHGAALSVGLFVDANIEGKVLDNAVRIPRLALHEDSFIYLAVDERLRRRPVTVLRMERDSVVIRGGFSGDEQLVLSRLDLMVEGMPVTPVRSEEGLSAESLATPKPDKAMPEMESADG